MIFFDMVFFAELWKTKFQNRPFRPGQRRAKESGRRNRKSVSQDLRLGYAQRGTDAAAVKSPSAMDTAALR